jgi:hypothetical protein
MMKTASKVKFLSEHTKQMKMSSFGWWAVLPFQVLDAFHLTDLYQWSADILKQSSRPLSAKEIDLARAVFGNSLPYSKIRIDEKSHLGPRFGNFAYVSFYTVNCWGELSESTFIHELVHIWQYEQFGAAYIVRALAAQHTKEGYNYGGAGALYALRDEKKGLQALNFEQQAEVVADYFRLQRGMEPYWGDATGEDLEVYAYFMKEIQHINA